MFMVDVNGDTHLTATELYELEDMPGILIGRPVVDSRARMVGIIRGVKLILPTFQVQLVIKGLDVEVPIDVSNVDRVGNVVSLKTEIKSMDPIEIDELLKLRRQLKEELDDKLHS
ncbi:MAG: hypothetical protein ACTSW4_03610, partial [Candidatus Ranarchaeia archaeon]